MDGGCHYVCRRYHDCDVRSMVCRSQGYRCWSISELADDAYQDADVAEEEHGDEPPKVSVVALLSTP